MNLPEVMIEAADSISLPLTEKIFLVSTSTQTAYLLKQVENIEKNYAIFRRYRCSTSKFGIGQNKGSNQTPLGLHKIAEKIGGDQPPRTVFKSRKPVGMLGQNIENPSIVHRILWLQGLQPGLNAGGEVDSHERYIYIHGTPDDHTIGSPFSHGCVHLSEENLLDFFTLVNEGDLVWIQEADL